MAEIQIQYRDYYCDICPHLACHGCETSLVEFTDCRYCRRYPDECGCSYIRVRNAYKGCKTQTYEINEAKEYYNDIVDEYALVTIRNKRYICDEVKIDGKIVYPKED